MNKPFIYVANWKMYMSTQQEISWVDSWLTELTTLSKTHTIVICPGFASLYSIQQILNKTLVQIGAQNCSEYPLGAHTGQVNIKTLQNLECSYCIIGHSEVRAEQNETNDQVAKKAALLLQTKITPIVCIGETKEDFENNLSIKKLDEQLTPLCEELKRLPPKTPQQSIIIAYEPLWAIGTGNIPSMHHLENILSWISHYIEKKINSYNWKLLYGGSVSPEVIHSLKKVDLLDGFLIGKASTNFQDFKKIVE